MKTEEKINCKLCRSRVLKSHAIGSLCRICDRVFSTAEDITNMLSRDDIPEWLTNFLPECASIFEEDRRFKKYYSAADLIILKSAFAYGGGDFPIDDLKKLFRSEEDKRKIFQVLSRAGIAELDGNRVHLEPLAKKICELIPAGADWGDPEIKKIQEQMRGWITFLLGYSLTRHWVEGNHDLGRPRNFLIILSYLCRLWDFEGEIPKRVHGSELFSPDECPFGVGPRQLARLLSRIIGLGGRYPKLFERSYNRGGGRLDLDLKPQTQVFIERERERYRERERGARS